MKNHQSTKLPGLPACARSVTDRIYVVGEDLCFIRFRRNFVREQVLFAGRSEIDQN